MILFYQSLFLGNPAVPLHRIGHHASRRRYTLTQPYHPLCRWPSRPRWPGWWGWPGSSRSSLLHQVLSTWMRGMFRKSWCTRIILMARIKPPIQILDCLKLKEKVLAQKMCLESKILLGVVLFQGPFDEYQYLLFVMCCIRFVRQNRYYPTANQMQMQTKMYPCFYLLRYGWRVGRGR